MRRGGTRADCKGISYRKNSKRDIEGTLKGINLGRTRRKIDI